MNLPVLPMFITKELRADRPTLTADKAPLVELDLPESIERAKWWLIHRAPMAIENAGGDDITVKKVVPRVKDFGISEEKCFELMLEFWNEDKARPIWDPEDLRTKVANGYAYCTQNAPGSASAEADFEPVDQSIFEKPEAPQPASRKLHLVDFRTAVQRSLTETAEPLVQGLLDCAAMSVIYGESNSGKTFVGLDIALHIASGRRWNGRKTKHGLVVYVAAEGGKGVYKRLAAWRSFNQVDPADVSFALIPCPVDLRSLQGDTKPLVDLIEKEQVARGEPVVLVVIDTLSRALAGGDENSPVDMGLIVKNCDRIRDVLGCHLTLIHHSGKNKAAGARGHSLLRAATDTEIEIDKRTILSKKQRDIEPIKDIRFDLKRVDLGQDVNGDAVSSCAVEIRTASEFERLPLDPQSERMLEAVERAARETAAARGAPDAWKTTPVSTALCDKHYQEINSGGLELAIASNCRGLSPRNFRRLRQNLVEGGYLKKAPHNQWLIA